MYADEYKRQWADIFQNQCKACKPYRWTKKMIEKKLEKVWNDDMFWFQCVERFGLDNKPLSQIELNTLAQAASNFYAMLQRGVRPVWQSR